MQQVRNDRTLYAAKEKGAGYSKLTPFLLRIYLPSKRYC